MPNKSFVVIAVLIILSVSVFANKNAENLAKQAVSADPSESQSAIKSLREMNQQGLDAVFEVYSNEIETFRTSGQKAENWQRISDAIDSVAMQKDAYASKLFWHTDLEQAKAEAAKSNKPILSLRLLGNLNEEFSCANSRFFRSILYSNAEISKYLRENYVLHWKSVRPAPKVTIDFGDGRKIERTLTGNSIHYVLDNSGRVIDAMPGLNSPHKFLRFVKMAGIYSYWSENSEKKLNVSGFKNRDEQLTSYRSNYYRSLYASINQIGNQLNLKFDAKKETKRKFEEMPPAMLATFVVATKMAVEIRILRNITADLTRYGDEQVNLEQWKQIAALSENKAKLDEQSRAFIRNQISSNDPSEKQFTSLIQKLEDYVSVDTARNEFLMRLTLLVWLNKGLDKDLEKLNEKVYSELFLTPNEDKWLGLYAPDLYTALDGNGVVN